MKISCNREKMLAAFQTAAAVAPARSPKPILQNVKLDVTKEGATLLATDLEIGIRVQVADVAVDSPGSAVLPVSRFGSILRENSDETLRIDTTDKGTTIRGERSKFELPAENPDEFPTVASFNEQSYHELPARLLKEIIRRTVFATDNESNRYALGGVLLEMTGDKLLAVATDGRRLAKMEGAAKSTGGHETSEITTIVPTRAMHLIDRSLSDTDPEIRISARGNDVLVQSERVTIYTRLLEGRFPRWRDVFPKRTDAVRIPLSVGPFYAAVRQAAIATSEESRGISFSFADGTATLTGKAAEVGQSHIELPIDYTGTALVISLDPRYVGDFLKVLDPAKTFALELKDSDSAAVCSTDDGYGYVIMPLARDRQ
ncbi:MAG TPA: DNA polymerase III subunit beta [Pirellulales bacterium]|jgi:DNA polymerase-3 subunit beta|nr:DNA polymerase III subunit beta [Pirellulales bacterium]